MNKLYNSVWKAGASFANKLQNAGILNRSVRTLLRKIGHILIPPPREEMIFNLPSEIKIISPAGFRGIRSYATGVYEENLTELFNKIVKENTTVVDVGALIGYYTLLASKLTGATGRVYAFEPEPKAYEYLIRNIDLNKYSNITAIPKAASDHIGKVEFTLSKDVSIGPVGGTVSTGNKNVKNIEAKTITLDAFFEEQDWPSVDLIKIDVDGAEKAVLAGMKQLSSRNPQMKIVMEKDPGWIEHTNVSTDSLTELLIDLGFKTGYIIEQKMKEFSIENGFPYPDAHYNVLLEK